MVIPDDYDGLIVEEVAGVDRKGEVVRFGLPFARGEWPKDKNMGFTYQAIQGNGKVRSCYWDIEQRWEDGSVRLAFCSAVLDLKAQSVLLLQPSVEVFLPEAPVFKKIIPIDAVRCQITLEGQTDSVDLQMHQLYPGWGKLNLQTLHKGIFEITGEIRQSGDDSVTLAFTIRNTTTRGQRISRFRVAIDSAKLVGSGTEVNSQIGYERLNIRRESQDRPVILQLSHEAIFTASNSELARFAYPIGGECRQNLVFARSYSPERGVNICVRNFGENFPVKLSLDDGHILFDLWPEEAGDFDWPAGMSKTYEFGMSIDPGGKKEGGLNYLLNTQYPLVPTIPLKRLSLLGCFPEIVLYRPQKYARIEYWIKYVLANRPRAFGFMHFGDEPNFGYTARSQDEGKIIYTNNEYDFPLIGLIEFCRTGDRLWYEDGRAAVLHMMDIDSVTASEDPMKVGGQYAHSTNHGHESKYVSPDHEWLEGLLLWYVLVDDKRAFGRAKALADRFVRIANRGEFDGPGMSARYYGWPLIGLCAFYSLSREQQYIIAAERIVKGIQQVVRETGGFKSPYWGLPYLHRATFMIGIAVAGLARYHRITQDEDVAELILIGCEEIMKNLSPEGVFYYKDFPLVRFPDPVSSSIALEALAYGYKLSNKKEYLVAGINNLEALLAIGQSGVVLAWGEEERKSYHHGAYMRARITEFNTQWAGIAIRGILPFLAQIEKENILNSNNNPFQWKIHHE